MKRVRYSKYTGDMASEMEMDDLLKALSDYLLDSGYRDPFTRFSDLEQTMSDLKEALRRALEAGDAFDEKLQEKIDEMAADGKLDELIDKLIERMEQENYLNMQQPRDPARNSPGPGQSGPSGEVRFEAIDKSLDFLGYKTLRDLLGSLGKVEFWAA